MKKVLIALLAVLTLAAASTTISQAQSGGRDCDANAIIRCGSLSMGELRQDFAANESKDLPAVFAHYGISSADVSGGSWKMGTVGKDGNVTVDGTVVATGARSVGRQNISGSSAVAIGGTTYYERATSVSFRSNSISALVLLDAKGGFKAAVITSCGNPVKATPKTPPKEEPKPAYACTLLTATPLNTERTRYRFDATATATGGAEIVSYGFGFGDGKGVTTPQRTYDYTYTTPGTYNSEVNVNVRVNGATVKAGGEKCKVAVIVPKPEEKLVERCDVTTKKPATITEEVAKDTDRYKPLNDEACKEQPPVVETPPSIPDTGPEALLGVAGIGAGSMTAAGYYLRRSRRNLIDALLRK